jgi:hypothetical protein
LIDGMTMGIVDVARRAARTAAIVPGTITVGLNRSKSSTIAGKRS